MTDHQLIMTDLTPDKRAELRELLNSIGYDNSEPLRDWMMGHLSGRTHAAMVDGAVNALPVLLDAADEHDRLAAALSQIAEVCHWSHDPSDDPEALIAYISQLQQSADDALDTAAAVERVRNLHERDGEGFCFVCDYMTPHPCPTLRALDDTDDGTTT